MIAGITERKMPTIAKNHCPLMVWRICSEIWLWFSSV